jgi:hypothetical protein
MGRAPNDEESDQRAALEELLRRHLPALRAPLLLRLRLDPALLDNLLQDFVTSKILENGLKGRADRQRGKFRNWLWTALNHFVDSALAARGYRDQTSTRSSETTGQATARQIDRDIFDEAWALSVWGEALRRMKARCQVARRGDLWGIFECRALAPALNHRPPLAYAELVERFGFKSPTQAAHAFGTARQMFERILRSVVGEYADGDEEAVAEMRELQCVLARSSGALNTLAMEILNLENCAS